MDTATMVNGKELHLKINLKYLTLFQLSLCLGTVLAQACGLLRRPVQLTRFSFPGLLFEGLSSRPTARRSRPFGSVGQGDLN
jgi:hypothetical protein